jgi:hypothetical protein
MLALKNASYLYDNAYDAYEEIKKLFIVSCVKLICTIFLPLTDATMALVFSFSFGIVEIIFAFLVFPKFFSTLSYISSRCESGEYSEKCEKMSKFTCAFTVIKLVLASLPDFTALSIGGSVNKDGVSLTSFRSLFFVISASITAVVGVIWLVSFIRFSNTLLNRKMLSEIEKNFKEQISPRKTIFISRDAMTALVLIFIGSFFVFDFNYNSSNVIPDCIFSLFALGAYLFMLKKEYIKYEKKHILFFSAVAVHTIACILEIIFEKIYLAQYDFVNSVRIEEAAKMYIPICVFAAFSSVAFVFVVFLVLKTIKTYSMKTIRENPKFYSDMHIEAFLKEYETELKKRNIASVVFSVIISALYILVVIFTPYKPSLTVLNSVFELLFIIIFAKNLFYVYDNVYSKMLKYS